MTKEEIERVKYFLYKDEWAHFDESDPLSCVYEVREIDWEQEKLKAVWLEGLDQNPEELPLSILLSGEATPLNTEKIEKEIERRKIESQEASRLYMKKLSEEWKEKEAIRDSHFKTLNPPLKRGTKVIPVGQYDRRVLDFSKKGDWFYIDDAYLENGELYYLLRVVAPRKNRGIYIFRTERGMKEEHLKIDESYKPEDDYDYRVKGETLSIRSLKEMDD